MIVEGVPQLHGVFANHQQFYGRSSSPVSSSDDFARSRFQATREIVEARFFAPRIACRPMRPAARDGGWPRSWVERNISPDW